MTSEMAMNLEFDIQLERPGFSLSLQGAFREGCTGIFGPSGAGKTTLFHAISGQLRPKAGRIALEGRTLFDGAAGVFVPPHRRRVGVVFQEDRLFPHLNVKKNLLFGCGWLRRRMGKVSFEQTIQILGIGHLLHKKPGQLSGGEKQRVAIGRALLASPEILLLDEPFSALDQRRKEEILGYLQLVHENFDIPLVIISHDLSDILQLTRRIYLIENGRCAGYGDYNDLAFGGQIATGSRGSNVLPFRVEQDEEGRRTLRALQGGARVMATGLEAYEPGQAVYAAIRPDEVAVSLAPVEYISIQNQLRAVVKGLRWQGDTCLVLADVDGMPVIADITARAAAEFGLAAGSKLWLLFKARAVELGSVFHPPAQNEILADAGALPIARTTTIMPKRRTTGADSARCRAGQS